MFDFGTVGKWVKFFTVDRQGKECLFQNKPRFDDETGTWENMGGGEKVIKRGDSERHFPRIVEKANPPTQSAQRG